MSLHLHTSRTHPDWESVAASKQNGWQRLAAATNGIITPANAVSLLGGVLVITGLIQFLTSITILGISLVAVGRFADIIDGYVADKTGTKSPLGELVDTFVDKFVAVAAIIVLTVTHALPLIFLVAIALHTIINSSLSLVGRSRKKIIHPSEQGKIATLLLWAVIVTYVSKSYVAQQNIPSILETILLAIAWILFILFVLLAVKSSFAYARQLKT